MDSILKFETFENVISECSFQMINEIKINIFDIVARSVTYVYNLIVYSLPPEPAPFFFALFFTGRLHGVARVWIPCILSPFWIREKEPEEQLHPLLAHRPKLPYFWLLPSLTLKLSPPPCPSFCREYLPHIFVPEPERHSRDKSIH